MEGPLNILPFVAAEELVLRDGRAVEIAVRRRKRKLPFKRPPISFLLSVQPRTVLAGAHHRHVFCFEHAEQQGALERDRRSRGEPAGESRRVDGLFFFLRLIHSFVQLWPFSSK